jgi:hypothetical protein
MKTVIHGLRVRGESGWSAPESLGGWAGTAGAAPVDIAAAAEKNPTVRMRMKKRKIMYPQMSLQHGQHVSARPEDWDAAPIFGSITVENGGVPSIFPKCTGTPDN